MYGLPGLPSEVFSEENASASIDCLTKACNIDCTPNLSPTFSSLRGDGTVFTRLYEHAVKNRYCPQNLSSINKAHPPPRSSTDQLDHVRDLMAKHWRSIEKIEHERIKLEEEQMKEVKDRPEICPESRTLADRIFDKTLKDYAKAELVASRSEILQKAKLLDSKNSKALESRGQGGLKASSTEVRLNPKATVGRKYRKIFEGDLGKPGLIRSKPETDIETITLEVPKHTKSLRNKGRAGEASSMPEINPESKTSAEKKHFRIQEDHPQAKAASIYQNPEHEKFKLETIKDPRPLSPAQIQAAKLTQELIHTFAKRSPEMTSIPTCNVNITTGIGSPIRIQSTQARQRLYGQVANLRNIRQLLSKSFNFDPIEPPDPLEMDFMERGKYWLNQKQRKLKEQIDTHKEHELDGCTFKPEISRLMSRSFSVNSFDSTLHSLRYADIHSAIRSPSRRLRHKQHLLESTMKSEGSTHSCKKLKTVDSEAAKLERKPVLTNLSPVPFKCSYKSGFNFNRFKNSSTNMKSKREVSLRLKGTR